MFIIAEIYPLDRGYGPPKIITSLLFGIFMAGLAELRFDSFLYTSMNILLIKLYSHTIRARVYTNNFDRYLL